MARKKMSEQPVPPHQHVNLDNTVPIDLSDEKYKPLLENLQGNILKPHGRDHSRHVFFRVTDPVLARAWITRFAKSHITSALEQHNQAERHKNSPEPGSELFASLMLSHAGYEALELEPISPKDPVFRAGMKAQDHVHVAIVELFASLNLEIDVDKTNPLGDPPVEVWEPLYGENDLHVMILLAHSSEDAVIEAAATFQIDAETNGLVHLGTEVGKLIRNEKNQVIEHFGHPTGISQPLFLKSDLDQWMKDNNVHHQNQIAKFGNPFASLRVVLEEDHCPSTSSGPCYGSFIVFRKLQQDVAGYNAKVQELAAKLNRDPEEVDAMVIGRFKSGRPLAHLQTLPDDTSHVIPDNFDFHKTPDIGLPVCPFQAHIRKSNPRSSENPLAFLFGLLTHSGDAVPEERRRRIARRSVSYGNYPHVEGSRVGMLFMAANANLALQFVFMQSVWHNNNAFPPQQGIVGPDTITGQTRNPHPHHWVNSENKNEEYLFHEVVKMRGGEYFFAPALSTLKKLKHIKPKTKLNDLINQLVT